MRPPIPSITLSRRAKIGIWTAVVLIALIIAVVQLSGVYINFLWFHSLGFGGVYATVFWTRVVLFAVFGVLMALILGGNMVIAYLLSPPFRPMSPEQQNIERYRAVLEPRRLLIVGVVSAIALFSAGLSAQDNWSTWQLWLHGGSFGQTDPQFHLDISFFAFDYPAYRLLLGFGFTAVVFAIILSAIVHYLTGAIRLQTPGPKVTVAARRHLTLLVFVFVVLKALAYWLDRYGLVFSDRSVFTGASYTDVHAVLPARTILFWIAIIIAAGLIASLWVRNTMLPAIAFVSMLVLSILISGIYPAILQGVSVKPNAAIKEAPYIQRNIQATRTAYNIASGTDVTYSNYPVTGRPNATDAEPGVSNATLNNIRILDPNIVSPTFAKFQAQGNQFGFAPKLDIDRYTVNGVEHDYIVGVRELDAAGLSGDQTNWINLHTTYTHGLGFVAADAGSNVTDPAVAGFAESGIPSRGFLGNTFTQDQVYYGELLPDYSIVGATGAKQEFNGVGEPKISYAGGGGVSLGSVFTRLAFAINYKQSNFLLNNAASARGARIIFNRDPRVMVQKLAPFLKIDSDPYPIVDTGVGNPAGMKDPSKGHVVWMVDGYTTTDNYPYSARESLSGLTNDSLAASNKTAKQPNDQINYIRNSVKATIDAYTGKVTLYAWDSTDPMLNAWRQVFPGLVKDRSQMPASIVSHVRYPQDLFKAQRTLLGTYHVDNPQQFYNASRIWTVPKDNTDSTAAGANQPPYYILASPPTGPAATAQFQLTSPMNVNQASYLAAYISADSDPAHYGRISVLQLPLQSNQVQGPEQAYNTITTDNTVRRDSLFNTSTNGANVVHGNLLTLPLGKSFLYAEPLYTISSNTSGAYPSLQRVILVYGSKIGYGKTVADARSDFLPGHCTGETLGLCTSSGGSPNSGKGGTGTGNGNGNSNNPPPSQGGATVTIPKIDQAIQALKDAYRSGDPVQVGKAEAALERLVNQYQAHSGGGTTAPKSPASSSSSAPRSPASSSSSSPSSSAPAGGTGRSS
ncbi:MAG TPA: UPF0182 family protein [Jatrophihabitans sp.]